MMDPRHQQIEKKFQELSDRLSHPETLADAKRLQEAAKEHAELEPLVRAILEYRSRLKEREDVETLLKGEDAEMRTLARSEVPRLEERIRVLEKEIRDRMAPKDPDADRNAVVEIRAGTGGEEAALFAADLFRMYSRYCERSGWKMELLDSNPTTIGGFKEIVFLVSGKGAYGRLRNESGTHRVQRVPRTESSGRIHTSAATVAVLPEADETEVKVRDADLRIDTFCSSGAGGQSVNTTYSAVRITHLPTGLVVQCQDERSQLKNKNRAMKVLYARLKEKADREAEESLSATRRSQVGSGDRSEKIRTYNFPQNRMTDHRIGLTLHQLDRILEGELEGVLEALAEARRRTLENGEG